MRISAELHEYAKEKGLDDAAAIEVGMHEKAEEFVEKGGEVYVEAE